MMEPESSSDIVNHIGTDRVIIKYGREPGRCSRASLCYRYADDGIRSRGSDTSMPLGGRKVFALRFRRLSRCEEYTSSNLTRDAGTLKIYSAR